jgi:hypothetical protein
MIAGRKRKFRGTSPISAAQPREDLRLVVINQPHRRGNPSNRLAEPAGRLLEEPQYTPTWMSRLAAHEAARLFSRAYANYQSALGSKRPLCNSLAGADHTDDPERDARYLREWADVCRELRWASQAVEQATIIVCCDPHPEDWVAPFWVRHHFLTGVEVLARHYGLEIHGQDKEHA